MARQLFSVTLYLESTNTRGRRIDVRRDFAVVAHDSQNAIAKAISVLVRGEFSGRQLRDRADVAHTAQEITIDVISIA